MSSAGRPLNGVRGSSTSLPGLFTFNDWLAGTLSLVSVATLIASVSISAHSEGLLPTITLVHSMAIAISSLIVKATDRDVEPSPLLLFAAVEWIRGSLVPLMDQTLGPSSIPFRPASDDDSAEYAGIIGLGFALVVLFTYIILSISKAQTYLNPRPSAGIRSTRADRYQSVGWLLFAGGMLGLALRFPSFGAVTSFLGGEYEALSATAEGPIGLLSSILRAAMLPGCFLLLVSRHERRGRTLGLAIVLAPFALLSVASFALNRASILLPLLACLVVWHVTVKRIPAPAWLALALAAAAAFFVVGRFRRALFLTQGGRFEAALDEASGVARVISDVQLYAQSPYFLGGTVRWSQDFAPSNLIASILSPVPGIPQSVRDESGTALYNQIIYGSRPIRDQIIPSWLEAYYTGGIIALLTLAVAIGALLFVCGQVSRRNHNFLFRYAIMLTVFWLAQSGITSVLAMSQASLYWIAPSLLAFIFLGSRQNDERS